MDEGAAGSAESAAAALTASRREVPRLIWRDSIGSTNTELARLAADQELESFTALVTMDQTAGRGRLDRVWVAPAGTALAVSVLVRIPAMAGRSVDASSLGWLPLAAGAAMFDAVADVVPDRAKVGIKWPNDVQVDGLKVCGILSELVPTRLPGGGPDVVIGAGLNIGMSAEQLPVPTATSLALAGAPVSADLVDRVLAGYLRALRASVTGFVNSGADAELSGLRAAVGERCSTIGREVRAELPGADPLIGRAVGIDRLGRLELRDADGRVTAVAAGDIIHLR